VARYLGRRKALGLRDGPPPFEVMSRGRCRLRSRPPRYHVQVVAVHVRSHGRFERVRSTAKYAHQFPRAWVNLSDGIGAVVAHKKVITGSSYPHRFPEVVASTGDPSYQSPVPGVDLGESPSASCEYTNISLLDKPRTFTLPTGPASAVATGATPDNTTTTNTKAASTDQMGVNHRDGLCARTLPECQIPRPGTTVWPGDHPVKEATELLIKILSQAARCLGARRSFGLIPVNLATVADADHLRYEPVVMNFVDDPVAAHTKPRSALACSIPEQQLALGA
jgi:hypothetical protein